VVKAFSKIVAPTTELTGSGIAINNTAAVFKNLRTMINSLFVYVKW
jgi:hypothetical protein